MPLVHRSKSLRVSQWAVRAGHFPCFCQITDDTLFLLCVCVFVFFVLVIKNSCLCFQFIYSKTQSNLQGLLQFWVRDVYRKCIFMRIQIYHLTQQLTLTWGCMMHVFDIKENNRAKIGSNHCWMIMQCQIKQLWLSFSVFSHSSSDAYRRVMLVTWSTTLTHNTDLMISWLFPWWHSEVDIFLIKSKIFQHTSLFNLALSLALQNGEYIFLSPKPPKMTFYYQSLIRLVQ